MKLLREFDYRDYPENGTVGRRPSVRAIIIRDGKLAMVYSEKYDYYLFPGGGIDAGESMEEALVREVAEELGLEVIPESIREYGLMVRREKGKREDLFIQENNMFLCDVTDRVAAQKLDAYEAAERYVLRWVAPAKIVEVNRSHSHDEQPDSQYSVRFMERENWLIERLMSEGYFA